MIWRKKWCPHKRNRMWWLQVRHTRYEVRPWYLRWRGKFRTVCVDCERGI